jgi:hypothetical protein
MEATNGNPLPHTPSPKAQSLELRLCHNPMLPFRQRRNLPIQPPRLPFGLHKRPKGNLGGGFSPRGLAAAEGSGR